MRGGVENHKTKLLVQRGSTVLVLFPEVGQQGKVGNSWLKTRIWLVLFVGKMLLSGCRDFWKDVLIYSQGSLFYRNGVNVLWRT